MDLVHEEHVAFAQVGEQRRQVAGPHERRAGGDPEAGAHLVGDDARQRGLAQARRAGEEHVVGRLPATPAGRLQHDPQVLLQLGLPDELGQAARPQRHLLGQLDRVGRRGQQPRLAGLPGACPLPASRALIGCPPALSGRGGPGPRCCPPRAGGPAPGGPRPGRSRARPSAALTSSRRTAPVGRAGLVGPRCASPPCQPQAGTGPPVVDAGVRSPNTLDRRRRLEARAQFQDQPGRRLLADARHQRQGVGVLGKHGTAQHRRRKQREQRQGQRRADPMRSEQQSRSSPAPPGSGSRRARWRPRGRGCGRAGTPARPAPLPARRCPPGPAPGNPRRRPRRAAPPGGLPGRPGRASSPAASRSSRASRGCKGGGCGPRKRRAGQVAQGEREGVGAVGRAGLLG